MLIALLVLTLFLIIWTVHTFPWYDINISVSEKVYTVMMLIPLMVIGLIIIAGLYIIQNLNKSLAILRLIVAGHIILWSHGSRGTWYQKWSMVILAEKTKCDDTVLVEFDNVFIRNPSFDTVDDRYDYSEYHLFMTIKDGATWEPVIEDETIG